MTNEILKDELLSEEQLDAVAGGTDYEIYYDADLLQRYGFEENGSSLERRRFSKWSDYCNSVIESWSKAGFICKYHENEENEYYLKNSDGSMTLLSHDDAGDYIRRNFEALY